MPFSSHRGSIASTAEAAKTAPVHEFRCLYTHDLRRKQKRWQDGFLKFHTFNKRVMVYDQPRNYIGDTHWKHGDSLAEGDELTLDNGVIVEVAEAVATTETDLTPILRKPREPANLGASPAAAPTPTRSSLPTPGVRSSGLRVPSQRPLHRPLTALLGTPKGAQGRAMVPAKSPYEERRAKLDQENEWASERAAKRFKVAEAGQARHAVIAAETPRPKARDPMGMGRSDARGRAAQKTPLAQRAVNGVPAPTSSVELIDITSDNDDIHSDVTLPETPPAFKKPPPARNPVKAKTALKVASRPPEPPRRASPPVSTTSKVVNVQRETELDEQINQEAEPPALQSPPRKTLKLAKGNRRKMLMCQLEPPVSKHSKPSVSEPQLQRVNMGRESRDSAPNPKETITASGMRKLHNGFTSLPLSESDAQGEPQSEERNKVIDPRPEKPRARMFPWLDKDRGARPAAGNAAQHRDTTDKSGVTTAKPSKRMLPPSPPGRPQPGAEKPTSPRLFRRIRSENDGAEMRRRRRRHEDAIVIDDDDDDDDDDDEDTPVPVPVPVAAPARPTTAAISTTTSNKPTTAAAPAPQKHTRTPLHRAKSAIITNSTALEWPRRDRDRARARDGGPRMSSASPPPPPPPPPADTDVGPWSTEAYDLFEWRPPGWEWRGQGRGFCDAVGGGGGEMG